MVYRLHRVPRQYKAGVLIWLILKAPPDNYWVTWPGESSEDGQGPPWPPTYPCHSLQGEWDGSHSWLGKEPHLRSSRASVFNLSSTVWPWTNDFTSLSPTFSAVMWERQSPWSYRSFLVLNETVYVEWLSEFWAADAQSPSFSCIHSQGPRTRLVLPCSPRHTPPIQLSVTWPGSWPRAIPTQILEARSQQAGTKNFPWLHSWWGTDPLWGLN